MKVKNRERVLYFDILNIIAIISVVAMHCNGIVHTYSKARAWSTSLIVDCVCYFAVPIFLMISGANLLNYRTKYDTKTFFKKRFTKVLIPGLFWIIVMTLWKLHLGYIEIHSFSGLIDIIINNKEESTYYFIWDILGIYLTIPLFSKIITSEEEDKKLLWYIVIVFFVFNSLLPYILSVMGINYNYSFSLQIGSLSIFVLLGYLLANTNIEKKKRIILYIMAVLGVSFRYFMTYYFSKKYGYIDKSTWGYTQFHSIILASAVFVFFKNLNYDKISGKTRKLLAKISSCSFGIYLIHLIVKHYEIRLLNINIYSWKFRTIGVVTTYAISLIIILALKKIPIIKKVVA